ncbi:MAG: gas vesicle protein [Solirubrobacterales bacterium]|nr:gas vesicle protein [Microbacteriaceae bacterium]MCW3015213.1 gas vesicle protein [Solirubrobacterales bacterium]
MPERPAANDGLLALWVYGVLGGDAGDPTPRRGVDPAYDIGLIRYAGLAAVASPVPLAQFGERGLSESLEDLDRLEALARAHEQVLDDALSAGAVVPFRMCTIYEREERVLEMLARERAPLTAALRRLRGMAEWGVKAYVAGREANQAATDAPASGTDYLSRKRAGRDAAEAARRALEVTVQEVHVRLHEQAADTVLSAPQDRGLSGHDGQMVLNAAYLVADADAGEFGSLVAELARRHRPDGLELELTGPWPAYHFSEAAAR